jgi:plasmid stability protein
MHFQPDDVDRAAMLAERNIPDEVQRAWRLQAAQRGPCMAAELREILESALSSKVRVKLELLLANEAWQAVPSDEELADFERSELATPGRLNGWIFDRNEANARGA